MKIIFAGTPDFAVPALKMLLNSEHTVSAVYTQPDRPSGRGRKLTPSPVKVLALQEGIPVFQPETLKSADEQERMRALNADLMVVVAYGMILPQAVLDIPKMGCINIHGSLLPRWRGAAPIQRAIMAGDKETGVTVMQIALKLDAGNMLHKEFLPLTDKDTASIVHDQLAKLGACGLSKVLQQIESGSLHPEVQDEALVVYAEKLTKQEATLDWTKPAVDLACQVRGLNAWPVAQTQWQGQVLRIWQATAESDTVTVKAGTVQCDGHKVRVATGEGWLNLQEVQLPGGKAMPIEAFINAHDLHGAVLA